ncbi:Protein kinase [Steccherinum ochraceum]|uniref:Protein kinase n=1 Tax=Steccherinum ochraceum TaxID=92696 RepID=A0A4R0RAV2_9APHY|nr:Protein kinase [Steccherinum ochraceum]
MMVSIPSSYKSVSSSPSVSLSHFSPPTTPPPLTPTITSAGQPIHSSQPSPALSDDSLAELSFAYERQPDGKIARVTKDSLGSKPSPPDSSPEQASPVSSSSSRLSPIPSTSNPRRSPLSRSESSPALETIAPTRSFQRVASGPLANGLASTPAATNTRIALLASGTGTGRKVTGGPRRVRLEDVKEGNERSRSDGEDGKQRELKMQIHEKENAEVSPVPPSFAFPAAQPLAEVNFGPQRSLPIPGRQAIPLPTRRLLKKIEPISETDDTAEDEAGNPMPLLKSSAGIRPRRSASMSETHEGMSQPPQFHQFNRLPVGPQRGARRVTLEEKLRQEREIALEEGYARREAEEAAEAERLAQALAETQAANPLYTRQSPSPTHLQTHMRPIAHHQRRDSDTLKSIAANMVTASSPTIAEALPLRRSPSNLGYAVTAAPNARHRRSPTAPEAPTTSEMIAPPPGLNGHVLGKTWAAGDLQESDLEQHGEEVPVPIPPQKSVPMMPPPPVPDQVAQMAGKHAQPMGASPGRSMIVNKKAYIRLDMIGRGGSSRVYRVLNPANELFAIKKVSLDKTDPETMNGYMNEIALLKRLDGNRKIIRLIDSEVKAGPGGSKGSLYLVMECGEIDIAKLLQQQQKEPLDIVWVSYYWKQMLQAVHVIHEEKIVHSDLKPANFVLVRGQVKLIDFGIANAIANDTTNIQRDSQIGTVNYMSPEAIEIPEGLRRIKVGRASDIWSLGCILYQMVYGQPPFAHLSMRAKMNSIPDPSHEIDFPEFSTPSLSRSSSSSPPSPPRMLDHLKVAVPIHVIDTIKACLVRNPKERETIPQILQRNWLANGEITSAPAQPTPPASPAPALKPDETIINPYFMQQLLRYGMSLGTQGRNMDEDELSKEAERLVEELQSVNAAAQS